MRSEDYAAAILRRRQASSPPNAAIRPGSPALDQPNAIPARDDKPIAVAFDFVKSRIGRRNNSAGFGDANLEV